MQVSICESITDISAADWNSLVTNNYPFVRHEFLHALETHGCVGEASGWLPRHIIVYDEGRLIGAMPLYEKHNSFGEFVFDHAWAQAYQQFGLRYYPKLVAAVPYTPICGPRLLAHVKDRPVVFPLLLKTAQRLAVTIGASGFHCLFPESTEQAWLESQALMTRYDCQYHWHNQGYASFDDFLSKLTSKKRKNICRERRRVQEAGITFRRLSGHVASDRDWQIFTRFYHRTFMSRGGVAPLNNNFFRDVAQCLPEQVLLVLADRGDVPVAGALMYCSDEKLYGRYWGCTEVVDNLHFETCYYQGIEHCIEKGLKIFEPGAQGEHKIARGFVPVLTRSSHWLIESPLQDPIRNFIQREQEAVSAYIQNIEGNLPYK